MQGFAEIYQPGEITRLAKAHFKDERAKPRLDGWFLARELALDAIEGSKDAAPERAAAQALGAICRELPLTIGENAVFAGSQSDAFARTYALINPTFRVESFSGYCDPTAVFDDIEPSEAIPAARIERLRERTRQTPFVRALSAVYASCERDTREVAYFVEQVTGHVIPDFRPALQGGVSSLLARLAALPPSETRAAMGEALLCAVTLAHRYAELARAQAESATDEADKARLRLIERTLLRVPEFGARNLYEALQSYMILWMAMCLEQAPNPFAFSVGNADRIFEPYRAMEGTSRALAAELFKCMLVFFNVGDRSWAISQNVLIGGRDARGDDLTNETSYALLDAYYDMNLPQPILSVKLHKNTPEALYRAMGRFFFTPGCLTPSLFNDDTLFVVLAQNGVAEDDLADYAVAGCQEPLIMGKDNGNTTNSWLNLPKILELTLNGGKSLITGEALDEPGPEESAVETLSHLRERFWARARATARRMEAAANGATEAVSKLPVPFLSAFMGGIERDADMRDTRRQGTRYNGSGCLIHGLSVLADSFVAVDHLLAERPERAEELLQALREDFAGHEELRAYLKSRPKFGNNLPEPDEEARRAAIAAADIVGGLRNNWGNPFRVDFSSPTTHLLYGYWVGATPDGRGARDMLSYGVDPLYGEATQGLGFRVLSAMRLPYERFSGGYASHLGVDPKYFPGDTKEEKGLSMKNMVLTPLFFNEKNERLAPSYLYMNITTAETLRKVLANPQKYAPSGVYIMRIHGTFVNFLDLSPAIQQDIITRLDPQSTKVGA